LNSWFSAANARRLSLSLSLIKLWTSMPKSFFKLTKRMQMSTLESLNTMKENLSGAVQLNTTKRVSSTIRHSSYILPKAKR